MDSKRKKILGAAAVVIILTVGYFVYRYISYVTTDNAQIQAHTVMLAPKIPGYLLKVDFNEGQHVKAGDVLVELDDRDYQNSLKALKGDLQALEAKRVDAERQFGRISKLYASEAVSQQQYDQSFAAVSEVRSKHEALSAQVAQAELNVSNTKIRAPSDGIIAKRSAEVGQLASPGVPLIGFVGLGERWVMANFKETDLAVIRIGAEAEIKVDALSGREFKGEVESMSSATGATFALLPPDNATGNFTKVVQRVPVRIKFSGLTEPDMELLRAGLSAEVTVHKR